MSKNIVKQFASFKTRHCLSDEIISKMVTEYANSEPDFARSYFSEKYNISKSIFYQARDFAIIFCLVDGETCKKVKRKTVANYKRNNPKNRTNGSISHFSKLCVKRQDLLNSFSDTEIRNIAFKYQEGISVKNIALAYGLGEYGIKLLLKKGIILLIVDGETTKSIHLMLGNKLNKILMNGAEKAKIRANKKISEIYFKIGLKF